jgi:hypothetical protein
MRKPLSNLTRPRRQRTAYSQRLLAPGIPTSLRLVARGCEGTYVAPTVDFHTNNATRFRDVFVNLQQANRSSYMTAISSATNDLSSKDKIEDRSHKLIAVFVSDARGSCASPLPPSLGLGSELSVNFFWLGSLNEQLAAIRKQLADLGFLRIKIRVIGRKAQLQRAVRRSMLVTWNVAIAPSTSVSYDADGATGPTGTTGRPGRPAQQGQRGRQGQQHRPGRPSGPGTAFASTAIPSPVWTHRPASRHNFGARNRIAMGELREARRTAASRTCGPPSSGNVVLEHSEARGVAWKCERVIAAFGLEIAVVARTRADLARIVKRNPLGKRREGSQAPGEPQSAKLAAKVVRELEAAAAESEQVVDWPRSTRGT